MDITTRVIQSSAFIHGAHWGRFIDNSFSLVIVKSRILEAYQLNDEQNSLYCLLEQNLGFEARFSTIYSHDSFDELILATVKDIKILKFSQDYFKITDIIDTGKEIDKISIWNNLLVVSISCRAIYIYKYNTKEIRAVLNSEGKLIDWGFFRDTMLILENDTKKQEIVWTGVNLDTFSSQKRSIFEAKCLPLNIVVFQYQIFVFGLDSSVFITNFQDLDTGRHEIIQGIYSSHAIFNNQLCIVTDQGILYTFDYRLVQSDKLLHPDSFIVSLDSLLFSVNSYGNSILFNTNFTIAAESLRNGITIDGVLMDLHQGIDYKSLIIASVNSICSCIYSLSRTLSIYTIAKIPKISKLSINAIAIDNYLFLLPDIHIINISNYEIIGKPEFLDIKPEKTLYISKLYEKYIQITENKIYLSSQEKYSFPHKALSGFIKDSYIVVGLISQTVMFFSNFSLVFQLENIDFSTLYISSKIYIGLQQSLLKSFTFEGEETETIETNGIPHSYS